MVEDKLWNLINRLLEQTERGIVVWEKTAARNSFQTAFPKHSVRISETGGETSEAPDYTISLFDETGRVVEKMSDVDLLKALKSQGKEVPAFYTMRDLYTKARRQALGVEAALDGILKSFEDEDVPF